MDRWLAIACFLSAIAIVTSMTTPTEQTTDWTETQSPEEPNTPSSTGEETDATVVITIPPAETTALPPTTTALPPTTTALPPTTTAVTTTPTTAPPTDVVPPIYEGKVYKINMRLKFNQTFTESLSDPNDQMYTNLTSEIRSVVGPLLETTYNQGYQRVTVTSFESSGTQTSDLIHIQASATIANYTIEYDMQTLVNKPDDVNIIFEYLTGTFASVMKNATINGSATDDSFIDSYNNNELVSEKATMMSQVRDPCTSDQDICNVCYNCNTTVNVTNCNAKCSASEYKTCSMTLENVQKTTCVCGEKYLPMSGSCVHQNIIIGVSAGVGGALLVGLVIALIIMSTRKGKKPKEDSDFSGIMMDEKELHTAKYKPTDDEGFNNPTYTTDHVIRDSVSGIDPMVTLLEDTDAYKNFQVNLNGIDPHVDYFAGRASRVIQLDNVSTGGRNNSDDHWKNQPGYSSFKPRKERQT